MQVNKAGPASNHVTVAVMPDQNMVASRAQPCFHGTAMMITEEVLLAVLHG